MDRDSVFLKIKKIDTSFLTVALEERLRIWKNTLEYEKRGESLGEIEECSSEYEAEQMIALWEEFIADVEGQIKGIERNSYHVIVSDYINYDNQSVDIMEITVRGSSRLVFVLNERGCFKLFGSLWDLILYFKEDKKAVAEFDVERELDRFLDYWDGLS